MPGRVTVIVPFFNRERFLAECVRSILRQTYPRIELLLVDDGSADRSFSIARSFAGPRVRVLRLRRRRGKPSAINRALPLSRGEWISFFDSDDRMLPDAIARRVEFLRRHPEETAVMGRIGRLIDQAGQGLPPGHPIQRTLADNLRVTRRVARHFGGLIPEVFSHGRFPPAGMPCTLFRRKAVEKAGFFNERFPPAEDLEYLWRASLHQPIAFLDVPILHCRIHGENISVRLTPDGFIGHPAYPRLRAELRRNHEHLANLR